MFHRKYLQRENDFFCKFSNYLQFDKQFVHQILLKQMDGIGSKLCAKLYTHEKIDFLTQQLFVTTYNITSYREWNSVFLFCFRCDERDTNVVVIAESLYDFLKSELVCRQICVRKYKISIWSILRLVSQLKTQLHSRTFDKQLLKIPKNPHKVVK